MFHLCWLVLNEERERKQKKALILSMQRSKKKQKRKHGLGTVHVRDVNKLLQDGHRLVPVVGWSVEGHFARARGFW